MIIDQLIKKYLQEYLQKNNISLIKEDKSQSGWDIKLLDYKSNRNRRAISVAQSAGAMTGLAIVATKKRNVSTNDALLDTDIETILEKGNIRYTGYPFNADTHLYILNRIKDNPYKKVWNLWVVDKDTSGINATADEIKKRMQSTKYYTTTLQKINRLQGIKLMTYQQAESWFEYLSSQKSELKIESKLDLPKLQLIKTDTYDSKTNEIKTQKVKIEYAPANDNEKTVYSLTNQFIIRGNTADIAPGFSGIAMMRVSADGNDLTFEPIEGIHQVITRNTNISGEFEGKFQDGAPYDGHVHWSTYGNNDDMVDFTGILTSKIYTEADGTQNFTFKYVNGVATYYNDFTYKGSWKQRFVGNNTDFDTGELYNAEGKLIGSYKNGEYTAIKSDIELQQAQSEQDKINTKITYPYTWATTDGDLIIYNDGSDKVFYFHINHWTSTSLTDFENKVVSGEPITFIPVINEEEQTRLDNIFNKQHIKNTTRNQTTPTPTKKTKYIVVISNKVNLYYRNSDGSFTSAYRDVSANPADKSTGHKLLDTKKGKIQNMGNAEYTMYYFKQDNNGFWIPSHFVKLVER